MRVYGREDAHTALVWMHGGAFMFGDLDMLEAHAVSAELAHRLPVTVVSVAYRFAPAVRFPVRWMTASQSFEPWHKVSSAWNRTALPSAGRAPAPISQHARHFGSATRAVPCPMRSVSPTQRCIVWSPSRPPIIAALASELPPLARFTKQQREDIYRAYLGPAYDSPPPYSLPADALPGSLGGLPPFVPSPMLSTTTSGRPAKRLRVSCGPTAFQ